VVKHLDEAASDGGCSRVCLVGQMTPFGTQTNLMVYQPGNFKFGDYVRLGLPLTLLTGISTACLCDKVLEFSPGQGPSPNTTLPLHMSDFSGGSTNMKLSDRVLLLLLFLAMLLILFKK
jgi:hypothetical protein